MILTFGLLALSICSVWLPPLPIGTQARLSLWMPIGIAAIIEGLFAGT